MHLHQAKKKTSKQHLFVSILKATDEKNSSRMMKLIHNPVYPYGSLYSIHMSRIRNTDKKN